MAVSRTVEAAGENFAPRRPWGRQIGEKGELLCAPQAKILDFKATDVRNPLILRGFTAQD